MSLDFHCIISSLFNSTIQTVSQPVWGLILEVISNKKYFYYIGPISNWCGAMAILRCVSNKCLLWYTATLTMVSAVDVTT